MLMSSAPLVIRAWCKNAYRLAGMLQCNLVFIHVVNCHRPFTSFQVDDIK